MLSRDVRGLAGGALLIVIGLFFAFYAHSHYNLGSFAQMGPGMMPLVLGIILMLLGVVIAIIGYFSTGVPIQPDARSLIAVTGAIVGFAVISQAFGMVPAVVALTIASGLADNKLSPLAMTVLTVILTAIAVGAFHFGLGIRMPLFAWPF